MSCTTHLEGERRGANIELYIYMCGRLELAIDPSYSCCATGPHGTGRVLAGAAPEQTCPAPAEGAGMWVLVAAPPPPHPPIPVPTVAANKSCTYIYVGAA